VITNPVTGKIYVTNTEARNEIVEGPDVSSTVEASKPGPRAAAVHRPRTPAEARVTVLDRPAARSTRAILNKHLDTARATTQPGTTPRPAGRDPARHAIDGAGTTLYVAAFGSSTVGKFNVTQLEANTFTRRVSHIPVTGGGPTASS